MKSLCVSLFSYSFDNLESLISITLVQKIDRAMFEQTELYLFVCPLLIPEIFLVQ